MARKFPPVTALLLGSGFLLFAGGINGLILPVRGAEEGFSSFSLGLLGTGWALGYVSGCIQTPRLVENVGHIRAFCAMAAFAAVAVLTSLLVMTPWAWILLRAMSGFCFAGAAMIVESWLSEQSEPSQRGRVFGIYTMVNLIATTMGQMTITLGSVSGHLFFVLAAIFYCFALLPTTISSTTSPKPLVSVRLDIKALWRNSPVAVFAVLMIGISNGAFGTLAAVYADRIGLSLTVIALFTSIPILAGAVAQIPVGTLSDKMDRRKVLVGIAALAICADLAFLLLRPQDATLNLACAALMGAMIYSMYPVILAHANDHATPGTYIQTSGGLLMVYGIGAIVGPLLAGAAMSGIGTSAMFLISLGAHVLIIAFAIWRMTQRREVNTDEKVDFVFAPMARSSTPETAAMNLRDDEEDREQ